MNRISKAKALSLLHAQIEMIVPLHSLPSNSNDFIQWRASTAAVLSGIFGEKSSELTDFKAIRFNWASIGHTPEQDRKAAQNEGLNRPSGKLYAFKHSIESFWADDPQGAASPEGQQIDILVQLLERFHIVVRQFKTRRSPREVFVIHDEYDVQYLLNAILKFHFDDIRPEEWTPSYAGGTSRMDFLLKSEKIVLEVKKTRDGLADKEVGEQLLVDIQRYQAHPDCKTLVCFVYDPDGIIRNPKGLENDLQSQAGSMITRVIIVPK